MSWTFTMERNPEPGERIEMPDYYKNYTYNVSPMFYDAIACPDGIRGLRGAKGRDCLPILTAAIEKMAADPEKYRTMNPKNGWGDYDGALETLRTLRAWCEQSPDAYMVIR